MSAWLLQSLATWGLPLLFATTFASCLALPVPSSLLMLAAGAFVASGDLPVSGVVLAALTGAIAGDQLGYWLGRLGHARLGGRGGKNAGKARRRAGAILQKRGAMGVFLSRWLFSPLGPYVNVAAGALAMAPLRFTLWAVLGEIVWVAAYVALGVGFASNITLAAELAQDTTGLFSAAILAAALGAWLYRRVPRMMRRHSH